MGGRLNGVGMDMMLCEAKRVGWGSYSSKNDNNHSYVYILRY